MTKRLILVALFALACGDDEPGMPSFEDWSAARPVPA
ncbi:MAG: hypothetical protein ACI9KE_001361, partial [Polyangiales bacterium]